MPDYEPPMPPPMHPPPPSPPSRAAVAIVAKHMSTAKKSRKKVFLTPEEALDRLLDQHERKKAKAAKKAVVTPGMFAIGDQEAPEEVETQPMVPVAKKAKAQKTIPVKTSVKTKKSTAGASGSQRRKKYAT